MEYIIGVLVSILAQWFKVSAKTNTAGTYLTVLVLSLIAAGTYTFLKDTSIWPVILQIVTVAGAFYAFVIKRIEELNEMTKDGDYLEQ